MRLRHKPWAEELIKSHPEIAFDRDDIDKGTLPSFSSLEIGSGCGEFLIGKALLNPDKVFLGVEINRIAFAIALKKLVNMENRPTNIYFINADVAKLLPTIKDGSIEEIYLNFNDPWPKKKQQKRRLTYPTKLAEYYRVLSATGTIYYKSDNDSYYEDSKEYFKEYGKFKTEFIDIYENVVAGDVASEYETKFRNIGKSIHRIIATKGE